MTDTATIMEVLGVDWFLGVENLADVTYTDAGFLTTATSRVDGDVCTLVTLAEDAFNPLVFGMAIESVRISTNGGHTTTLPIHIDTTDGNGNGILIATDRLFVVGGNVSGGTAATYICKILYRMVNVGITEYVGIVQSQQN